jgi:diketogulonate reductase-like aldo/keto reductase
MASIPAIELNDGSKCPLLGLGTYGSEESGDRDKIVQAVYDAIVAGYRHFDTAYCYEVEDKVGEGIKKALDEGLVKRDDLFVVTKIWSTKHRPEKVAEQARESLKALGLDYVDLMLIHWPVSLKDFVPEGAKGMAKWMPANEDGTPMEDTEVCLLNCFRTL